MITEVESDESFELDKLDENKNNDID